VGAYNRESEAGMMMDAGEYIMAGDTLYEEDGRVYRLPVSIVHPVYEGKVVEYGALTAADMNRITEYRHILIGEQGPEMLEVTTIRKFIPSGLDRDGRTIPPASMTRRRVICPNCGTTKHHKGFRPWEECDGCGAEWRTG
jgi:hypothetical protein